MDEHSSSQRESMLTVVLTGMVVFFILFVLILITGGWVFWLVQVIAAITFLCLLHYVLWGKLMSDSVAGEREEEMLRQQAEEKESEDR